MAEAMVLSSLKLTEMYPPSDMSYSAKTARKAVEKGYLAAVITDEDFSKYSSDIRFLYKKSEEMLQLLYSHRGRVKMQYVIDHSLLSENKLIVAFSLR